MAETITIEPITRIEGHARVRIILDDNGNVKDTRLQVTSLRGFEQFVIGRQAEEIPRIVTRICGICPWMHHLAAVKAVDGCFGVTPPRAGSMLRELCQVLAHVNDKLLHFFFLAGPDFLLDPDTEPSARNIMTIARTNPELAARVVEMRQLSVAMLERFAGRALHPVAGVAGGFSRPMTQQERKELLADGQTLLDFACYALEYAREKVFQRLDELFTSSGDIHTGFLGTVDDKGALRLYNGNLRLMKEDGTITDFPAENYLEHLAESPVSWSYSKMVYAASWQQGFALDPDAPRGIYRTNTLARLNICDYIATPLAQQALEEFREKFGRPAQSTLLFHRARLIELVYACERIVELLENDALTDPDIRTPTQPAAGRGIGHVEAPRGTLIHDYTTDGNGCIVQADMIVGTTHNIAPMNLSVNRAARGLIHEGRYDESILNKIEAAVRAYDP